MVTNDIAIRFTEEKYATKSEVIKDLKISPVDSFWNKILDYRKNFYHYTPLKTIEKNTLVFCGCPSVNSSLIGIENKLLKINRQYSSLFKYDTDVRCFEDESLAICLDYVSKKYHYDFDKNFFKCLVRNEFQEIDESTVIFKNYLNALEYIKTSFINNIDEDYLANLYSKLLGTDELTSFYRTSNDNSKESRVLIDRVYTSAPSVLISDMMNSLFSFITTSSLTAGVKSAIAYFYINYIKPFDKYSDEIALLIAKSIICHESLGELGVYLPIERLLSIDSSNLVKMISEVTKSTDLTYFVNYYFKAVENVGDELLDMMANLNVDSLKNDYFKEDKLVNNEVEEQKPEEQNEVVEELSKEDNQQPNKINYVKEELAISYIPIALDEKTALLVENDLLERDPSLRKGEAYFYARHCTKGKKYSIAQYKKSVGCVYETARTSMDHLAELGYYRKEKIKNKFVYVPISRN